MIKIISPKTSRRLPSFVDKDDIQNLLDKVQFENNYIGPIESWILEKKTKRTLEVINFSVDVVGQEFISVHLSWFLFKLRTLN